MGKIALQISGMRCAGCVGEVGQAIAAVDGVTDVDVSLDEGRAIVQTLQAEPTPEPMVAAVREAGFEATVEEAVERDSPASPPPAESSHLASAKANEQEQPDAALSSDGERGETIRLDIEGMHCASCVSQVESSLAAVDGVAVAHVNLPLNQATVRLKPDSNAAADEAVVDSLLHAVERAGYRASTADTVDQLADWAKRETAEQQAWLRRFLVASAGLAYLILAEPLMLAPTMGGYLSLLIAAIVHIVSGAPFYRGALLRLKHGSANMDSLVALGSGAALAAAVAGQFGLIRPMPFLESVMILAFLSLGRWLESRARRSASAAIMSLMEMTEDTTRVVRGSRIVEVATRDVQIDEVMVVEPGESVPLDGRIIDGQSHLDESWLSGEAKPVAKREGDEVFAGAVNQTNALRVRVARGEDDTVLARVVQLVRDTQQTKTHVQRLADTVVAWFTPAVLLIAAVTMLSWWLMGEPYFGLHCTIAVLVVACPCALGLATPTAILVASGRAAKRGLLIRNAEALEVGGLVDAVLLDKTGTITAGEPQVAAIRVAAEVDENELLRLAASVESLSRHPLAKAIRKEAEQRDLPLDEASSLEVHDGEGVEGRLPDCTVWIGNERLLRRVLQVPSEQAIAAVPDELQAAADEQQGRGRTVVWVLREQQLLGWLAIADAASPGAAKAIETLKADKIRVAMATGDRRDTAEAIAREVGLEEIHAELQPADKLQLIERWRKEGRRVAMVGDGVNDSPALAAADLAVAMGAGADIALEAADVVLVERDLSAVVEVLGLARTTRRIIRQNLAWAFAYNVLLIPVAAGVFAVWGLSMQPALAAAAMALSSVSVVLNALRVRVRASD